MSAAERNARQAVDQAQKRLRVLEVERDRLKAKNWTATAYGDTAILRELRSAYAKAETDCRAARDDLRAAELLLRDATGGGT